MAELRRFLAVVQDPRGYPVKELDPAPPEGPQPPMVHSCVKADEHEAAMTEIRKERDEVIRERDEMRKGNITPEDADRPLGQSVEYWQDRCLDHAIALDRARVEIAQLRTFQEEL